jgi:cytochrome c biogenesis protein CcdA
MPAYVATLLGALVASPFVPQARWLALALAGAYLLGNLSVSFLTAARSVWHYLPWLPIIFGIIHLSWGTGFLVRLVALPFSHRRHRQ